jgi:AhpC/TSA family
MNPHSKLVVAVAVFCAARSAFALSPGETVDNFRLLDHQGGSRELYYLSDMKAVVLMAEGAGCEASRAAVPGLKALRDQYPTQGVAVLMIDSNLPDTSAAIVKEAADQASTCRSSSTTRSWSVKRSVCGVTAKCS